MPQRDPNRERPEIGPSTPLREVRLGNFKSVRTAAVELRPLTAIVGQNSSGKSTLLQGILALAQAVRGDVVTPTFPLNGELVRLGTFDEVRNFDVDPSVGVDIGFTAALDLRLPVRVRKSFIGIAGGTVKWDAHLLASAEDGASGQADLDTVEFEVDSTLRDSSFASVSLAVSEILDLAPETPADPTPFFGRSGPEHKINGRVTDTQTGRSSPVDRMTMSGGLPTLVFSSEQQYNVLFRLWWDLAFEMLAEERHEARQKTSDGLENDETRAETVELLQKDTLVALKFAKECLISDVTFDGESGPGWRWSYDLHQATKARFEKQIEKLRRPKRRRIANAMNDLGEAGFRERLRVALVKASADWLDEVVRDEPPNGEHLILEGASISTYNLFRRVHYLGPLRAKPQVMYSPGAGQVDLGPEGEHAAAYLHANAMKRVTVPLPEGGTRAMPLGEGLNLWLEELDLADGAVAMDRGRLGIGLYVQPVGRTQSVDLTSVGVGVSQALPVVLLCLLAGPQSIVLIEQPELHLHPAMQLKLADFLLACTRAGRQIVFETHSEHLINRLRLRVAADESSATGDVVRLLFAEQTGGETIYRISDVNEVGGLSSDWPKGFLDVAADESTRLLQQSLAKKRAVAEKKS